MRPRDALTLIEVLISIFVLAVGLLGVAALLPVGQQEVQRGAIKLRSTDLAEKAFAAIETHGVNDPTRWLAANPATAATELFDVVDPVTRTRLALPVLPNSSGTQIRTDPALLQDVADLRGCLVEFIRGNLKGVRRRASDYNATNGTFNFAGGVSDDQDAILPEFPDENSVFVVYRNQAFAVDPYFISVHGNGNNEVLTGNSNGAGWSGIDGMPRISLSRAPRFPVRMGYAQAESVFVTSDEEVFEKPADESLPPRQRFIGEPFVDNNANGVYEAGIDVFNTASHDLNGNGQWDPLKRQFHGNFSWLVTFFPADGGVYARDYLVSVAVFYKRNVQVPKARWAGGNIQWEVDLFFPNVGKNLGGGPATLISDQVFDIFIDFDNDGEYQRDVDRLNFAPGQWILVSNRQRGYTMEVDEFPDLIYRWYRIAAVGEPYEPTGDPGRIHLDVRLVGSDWDAVAIPSLGSDSTAPPYMATAFTDLVGVFQRRMRTVALPPGSVDPLP